MSSFTKHLKEKWNINSNWSLLFILITFSLAGMSIVFVRKPLFHILGVTETTPMWWKVILYLLIIFPTYQINLLLWGTILGQFQFFWEKEKKLWGWLLHNKTSRPTE